MKNNFNIVKKTGLIGLHTIKHQCAPESMQYICMYYYENNIYGLCMNV